MTNSEWRSTSVPRETNGQDQTTPEHVTVASVSLSALLTAKNSFYKSQNHLWTKFLLVPSHISLVPVPLPLVPGSITSAQCCTRYHPSGTMVPLPCHPPRVRPVCFIRHRSCFTFNHVGYSKPFKVLNQGCMILLNIPFVIFSRCFIRDHDEFSQTRS